MQTGLAMPRRNDEACVQQPALIIWLAATLMSIALVPEPAGALTPIDSADLSPDITVVLEGLTISDEDVARDDLSSGIVTKAPLGPLPQASDLSAYHDLGRAGHLLVFDTTVALAGGITASPNDVVRYDTVVYSIEFDASAESVPDGVRIDAVSKSNGGNLVLSFDTTVELSGATYADEDLVEFDGDGFTSFFDGSAVGLDTSLDIDGAHIFESSGNLALSFDTGGSIGGVDFDDEDVLEYDPLSDTWEMAWDASSERPGWVNGADVNAVYFVPEPSQELILISGSGLLAWLRARHQRI